jgi:hypothetical protein
MCRIKWKLLIRCMLESAFYFSLGLAWLGTVVSIWPGGLIVWYGITAALASGGLLLQNWRYRHVALLLILCFVLISAWDCHRLAGHFEMLSVQSSKVRPR